MPCYRLSLSAPLRTLLVVSILGLAAGCSTTDQTKAVSAATTPLNDLNLANAPIPEVLVKAYHAPYVLPAEQACDALVSEINALDEVLGPDLDAPSSEAHRSLLERGTDEASGAAVGAIQRTAEGVIPFRGWVRKLTGAERYSKRVAGAITAGGVRRAFLKGVRAARPCPA